MKPDFRSVAKKHLARAKTRLEKDDEPDLVHAALELRMSMEAIVYGYAQAYAEELPPLAHNTWQPRKVLELLLEIDPHCDKDATIAVGTEEEFGVPAPTVEMVGKETRLSLKDVKKHYDRLGSHLHIPTIAQFENGRVHDFAKLRTSCTRLAGILEGVLSSLVFNVTFGETSQVECSRCERTLVKCVTYLEAGESVAGQCPVCNASYTVTRETNRQVTWEPNQISAPCTNPACGRSSFIWQDEVEFGRLITCPYCEQQSTVVYSLQATPARSDT